MKKPNINFHQTKDELGRRRSAKQGQSYNQTKDTAARWAEREKAIVQFARSLGENLDLDRERRQNASLLR